MLSVRSFDERQADKKAIDADGFDELYAVSDQDVAM